MNIMIKRVSGALLIGLCLAGAVTAMRSLRNGSVAAVPQDVVTLTQLPAVEALQADTFQVDATLVGTVELKWGAAGTYSDTWTAAELNVLTDIAAIDLALLLAKGAGDAVTGYVDLQNSLVFTTQHLISTTVASAAAVTTKVGPQRSGSYAGNPLNLLSERISYTTETGQTVQRQFRLTAAPNPDSAQLVGEYRETVWGLTLQPLTIGGTFKLTDLKAAPVDVNRAPVANPQTVSTLANTAKAIQLTGSDADNNALTYTIVTNPTRGTLNGTAPNVTYMPKAGFSGSDSFTFRVNDGKVDSDAAAVTITIEVQGNTNHPPTAVADAVTTTAGVTITISVLANDADPDGDVLTVTINQQPKNGSATVNGDMIIYTPRANFSGVDSFSYTVTDSKGATASATITIMVKPQVSGAMIYLPLVSKQ